jgi:hypothetical protein
VLVVARGYLGYQGRLVLVRYLSDGSPDPSFGAAGIDWLTTPGGSWSGAGGAVAPDGRLLASGYLDPSVGLNETAVVRVLTRDAPVASITSAPEGLVNRSTQDFAFTADDPSATFRCFLDGEPGIACDSPFEWAGIPNGTHTFEVRASDAIGNEGPSDTAMFDVDERVPDHQPDVTIQRPNHHEVGVGWWETSGRTQDVWPRISPGETETLQVRVKNAGLGPDALDLVGSPSGKYVQVRYVIDGSDVSNALEHGYRSAVMARLDVLMIRMVVHVERDAPVRHTRTLRFAATWVADPARADAVLARVAVT